MSRNNIYFLVIAIYAIVLIPDVIKLIRLAKKPSLKFQLEQYIFRIHLLALVCGFILSIILITFEVNIFNYSAPIEYFQLRKITLDDFNGLKLPNQHLQGSNKFAFIKSSISLDIDDNKVEIKSYFHPARSYVYSDNLKDEDLLRHEMYHFHITEIWARKLRRKISGFQTIPSRNQLDIILKKIILREDSMQQKYDYNTDHGYLLGNQIEWQRNVDSSLLALEPYSGTSISF